MADTIRVLLIDEQRLLHSGVRALLSEVEDVTLVGQAVESEEAVHLARQLQPDVLLLALNVVEPPLPALFDRLKAGYPSVPILALLSGTAGAGHVLAAGAAGCFLKRDTADNLFVAIRAVARGDRYLSPSLVKQAAQPQKRGAYFLTERELDVLRALVSGETQKETALALGISDRTVRSDLESICQKLGVETRVEAAYRAGVLGLFTE